MIANNFVLDIFIIIIIITTIIVRIVNHVRAKMNNFIKCANIILYNIKQTNVTTKISLLNMETTIFSIS